MKFFLSVSSVWSTWHDESLCSVTCGEGVRTRIRSCHDATHHHHDCPGPSTKTESCRQSPCPGNRSTSCIFPHL